MRRLLAGLFLLLSACGAVDADLIAYCQRTQICVCESSAEACCVPAGNECVAGFPCCGGKQCVRGDGGLQCGR